MKLEQLRAQITAEKVNDKFAQIFGEKVSLNNFTTEQLSSTRDKVLGKLGQIQNTLSFDSLNDSEDYQKQRMLLDLLTERLKKDKQTKVEMLGILLKEMQKKKLWIQAMIKKPLKELKLICTQHLKIMMNVMQMTY